MLRPHLLLRINLLPFSRAPSRVLVHVPLLMFLMLF